MRTIMLLATLCFGVHSAAAASTNLPSRASIKFTLSNIDSGDQCPAVLNNASVAIDYDYNFERNTGLAYIRKIQSSRWATVLHPMGISDYYGFISDIPPTEIQVYDLDVTVYRIIFHLYKNGDAKLMMMFNQDGDCVMSSNIEHVPG